MFFIIFFKVKGIYLSVLVLPHHKKMVLSKEKNCHLLDVVRILLLEPFVTPCIWCEALSIIVHLINK